MIRQVELGLHCLLTPFCRGIITIIHIFRCYMNGINLNPLGIFPEIEFPVPRGTEMLSPLISWDHTQSWVLPSEENFLSGTSGRQSETVFEIFSEQDKKDHYLTGNMSGIARKPVFWVSDQVRHKPGCTATEDG